MYKIVLKVPEIVFVIFIFLPVFLIISGYFPDAMIGMILSFIGLLTGVFWMLSVSDYMDKALGQLKTDWIFILMLLLFCLAASRDIYQSFTEIPSIYRSKLELPVFSLIFGAIVSGILTYKIKKIFTERSIWFVFIEVLFYGIGVATLSPEIKNHYRENKKKMDQIFSNDTNDSILH